MMSSPTAAVSSKSSQNALPLVMPSDEQTMAPDDPIVGAVVPKYSHVIVVLSWSGAVWSFRMVPAACESGVTSIVPRAIFTLTFFARNVAPAKVNVVPWLSAIGLSVGMITHSIGFGSCARPCRLVCPVR